MGEVYKARDTRLNRLVAVKVLAPGKGDNGRWVSRFLREAQAASALNHQNIVTVYDIGVADGRNFMAMELVAGETLRSLIRPQGMPLDQVLNIGGQVIAALAAAHSHGIVHRDLKPGNVMVTPEGVVKLLDFGLAKLVERPDPGNTQSFEGEVLGTFAYMSPEQVRAETVDGRSDIFSLGALLYEMLSGQRAFSGVSSVETASAVLRDEPRPLQGVPPGVTDFVSRCLCKNPAERYQRISDAQSALERTRDRLRTASEPPSAESDASIAVLPFANLSSDKENEYFSDGLAEEILNALTRVPGLKVSARTSSFAFRDKDDDVRKIGEALGVRTVLEGSVRRAGNRIRVMTQLVDARNGYHLWSERYDREMNDTFAVQDEIAGAVVDMLKPHLVAKEQAPVVRRTASIEAHESYLKGSYHFYKLSPQDVSRARQYFEEAIALDPEYAAAYVGLARCFSFTAQTGLMAAGDVMPLAKAAALKAVQLEARDPDAHAVLGTVLGAFDYDWDEALRHCRLALAGEVVSSNARHLCAQFILMTLGLVGEGMAALEPALTADPLSPFPRVTLAQLLRLRQSYDRAILELRRVLEFQQEFWLAYFHLGVIYTDRHMVPEAIDALERGLQLAPWFPLIIGLLAGNYVRAGNRTRAETLLTRLANPDLVHICAMGYAVFHVLCGEFEAAAGQWENAIAARDRSAVILAFDPMFERFRAFPGCPALLQKMNLAQAEPLTAAE